MNYRLLALLSFSLIFSSLSTPVQAKFSLKRTQTVLKRKLKVGVGRAIRSFNAYKDIRKLRANPAIETSYQKGKSSQPVTKEHLLLYMGVGASLSAGYAAAPVGLYCGTKIIQGEIKERQIGVQSALRTYRDSGKSLKRLGRHSLKTMAKITAIDIRNAKRNHSKLSYLQSALKRINAQAKITQ